MPYQQKAICAPHYAPIPAGLNVGANIVVRGRVSCSASRFHINFQNGKDNGCDIGFHFNPRNNENQVVRNSFQGCWKNEERCAPHFPFGKGTCFTINFVVFEDAYKVYVNGCFYIEFKHRLAIQDVRYLVLSDGADYYECTIQNALATPDYTFLPGGLNFGALITVRGKLPCNQERFHINLQTDQEDGSDIAFHFNPRANENTVVRNSYEGGWKTEERCVPNFPFTKGANFFIQIYVDREKYMVYVNGKHYINFCHRIAFQDVYYLKLSEGAEYYETTIRNKCRVPYDEELPGGLHFGKSVRVRGYVNDNAERFAINFMCDAQGNKIGVHFNPRQDQEDVVLNTKTCGWGQEERGQGWFPFPRGQYFDVQFITYECVFFIYVNGKYFTSYKFRVPAGDMQYLQITGDVTLMDVDVVDPIPCEYVKGIPSGFDKSDMIVCRGFFYPKGERFFINLLNGQKICDDVALHIAPRRDEGKVVLNSRFGGCWGQEQRICMPQAMVDLVPFEIKIVTKCNKFKIYINGRHLADFCARGKFEDIKGIHAGGDAYIYEMRIMKRVEVPYVEQLPAALEPGTWLSVIGTPKKCADRFEINFQTGDEKDHGGDIAFHFNPRFCGKITVRNSKQGGSWRNEERCQPSFPFEREDEVKIDILFLKHTYKVFVDNKHYIDFNHRIAPCKVTHIMMTGAINFYEPEFY